MTSLFSPNLFALLDAEWSQLTAGPRGRRALRRWASVDPRLAGISDLGAVLEGCATRPSDAANALLAALVDTGDELAHRACLQALLPLIRSTAALAERRGWVGPDCYWPTRHDLVAELVSETWAWLRRHTGSCAWPASRLHTRLWRIVNQRQRLHLRRPRLEPAVDDAALARMPDPGRVRSIEADAAQILVDAYRDGVISLAHAQLLYAVGVRGENLEALARTHGVSVATLRSAERRGRLFLTAALAEEGEQHSPKAKGDTARSARFAATCRALPLRRVSAA